MKIQKIIAMFLFCLIMFSVCEKQPDQNSIRLYANAHDAYSKGRLEDVMEILNSQNNFPPALILRAKAEYFYGDLEKAKSSFRRTIKLRPSSAEANLYLARIYRTQGSLAEAEKIIENLLADNPQDIRALRFAAELASDAGKFDEAVILLDKASEFSAESAMVLLDRARLRWIAGKNQEALDDINRARAMLPWDTPLIRSISNLEKTIKEAAQ